MFLLLITLLGTSMVIGDGILAPCISVLSVVGGIKAATSTTTEVRSADTSRRTSKRVRQPPEWYKNYVAMEAELEDDVI
ncbi:hypothetical protein Pint_23879 [Pistacia integerrima]|uniref:Uncharacterized protein n=1 Tax=Pistacia integerrima TaxID=434235 RepID=A0ACC0YKM2_9ROSI|nr:hypothetical protein Pint_23879 [Pistacia integerrima]